MSCNAIPLPYALNAAVTAYGAIADMPWAMWLDSGGMGRYDILCAQPVTTLLTCNGRTEICADGARQYSDADPFDLIRAQLGAAATPEPDIPFAGGALGYWGYDLARGAMALPQGAAQAMPDMAIGIYDWAIVIDHQARQSHLVSRQRNAGTARRLPDILQRLQGACAAPAAVFRVTSPAVSNLNRERYAAAFARVQDYLRAGDCYQVNLAQRFSADVTGDASSAYLELRRLNPAPYSALLNIPQGQILCVSPERFLRVRDGHVETRPIKGTRPRGSDAVQDEQLAEELRRHPKDRAENLMIVDLLRNDLSKNCATGSVRVSQLFDVESYSNVHHLVSTVEGRLAEGRDALHLLRDCFPGGSVTGAPKRRAMQIIDELEPDRRGVYCGAIGYAGFDGNMDSNIAIRTLARTQDKIHCWAGGGLVADSVMEAEYQETLDKAAGMLAWLRRYGI
ncbi:MAG: aminodeoxychorismate synthase component I [Gallionellaceae bacterium]|jgi:para-aminobenzoate synthetase component 1|nr:aminodeoxychorismate synthase component I [Gallionellaceae bacterium]